jgi:sigma-B regulation protein RsbQ
MTTDTRAKPRLDREAIGKRNHVTLRGRGEQVMLFAHGFGCHQVMWRYVAPAFEDDYRVVLFDYVGSGKSDWSAWDARRYAKLDGYARDVLEVIEAFDLRDIVAHYLAPIIMKNAQDPELTASWRRASARPTRA